MDGFLTGYRDGMANGGSAIEQSLLDLFVVEKAAYEIAYEAANRPAWIDVPLRGLARLVRAMADAAEHS
jgi:maltose alpha-D-glucosyltransferase/alpha-amylase